MNMNIQNADIDGGNAFDWGRTSGDYAKFRDIYPEAFYGDSGPRLLQNRTEMS